MSEASIRMASDMLSQSLTLASERSALKRERDEALARALAAEQLARDAVQAHADEETRADAAKQRLATCTEALNAAYEFLRNRPRNNAGWNQLLNRIEAALSEASHEQR